MEHPINLRVTFFLPPPPPPSNLSRLNEMVRENRSALWIDVVGPKNTPGGIWTAAKEMPVTGTRGGTIGKIVAVDVINKTSRWCWSIESAINSSNGRHNCAQFLQKMRIHSLKSKRFIASLIELNGNEIAINMCYYDSMIKLYIVLLIWFIYSTWVILLSDWSVSSCTRASLWEQLSLLLAFRFPYTTDLSIKSYSKHILVWMLNFDDPIVTTKERWKSADVFHKIIFNLNAIDGADLTTVIALVRVTFLPGPD